MWVRYYDILEDRGHWDLKLDVFNDEGVDTGRLTVHHSGKSQQLAACLEEAADNFISVYQDAGATVNHSVLQSIIFDVLDDRVIFSARLQPQRRHSNFLSFLHNPEGHLAIHSV